MTQIKPPKSWVGTPGEEKALAAEADPENKGKLCVVFEGNAAEAASQFPKNANVSCMLALATVGLEKCRVKLATIPGGAGGSLIEYSNSRIGDIKIEVSNSKMLESNPKTSACVPLSVVKSIRNLLGQTGIGW